MTPEDVLRDQTYNKLRQLGNVVDEYVNGVQGDTQKTRFHFPMKWVLVAWPYGQLDRANHVTNCHDRLEIIRSLDEIAGRLDAQGKLILPPHF